MEKIYSKKFVAFYDYGGYGPDPERKDIVFYTNYFKDFKGRILEIGAGTGGITIPLLKKGINLTALDVSPGMLEILKAKLKKERLSARIIRGDMRKLNSRDKFDAVIITFRPFQHLYSVADQVNALASIKKALREGGMLIFDVFNPSWKYISKGNWRWQKSDAITLPSIRGKIRVERRNRYDMAEQIMHEEWCFIYPNNKKEIAPLKMRFFFRFEIEHLLRLTGFKVKNLYGDFDKSKFKNDSPEMIWVAQSINTNHK